MLVFALPLSAYNGSLINTMVVKLETFVRTNEEQAQVISQQGQVIAEYTNTIETLNSTVQEQKFSMEALNATVQELKTLIDDNVTNISNSKGLYQNVMKF